LKEFLGKLVYVFRLWIFFWKLALLYGFGLWTFFYKLVYVFMFSGLDLLVRFLGFLKLMCLYIEVPKTNVESYIKFDFIKERILFVLGLGLWFLSKINIFVANLHLTYQSARLRHPLSLSYSTLFSDLFTSCLLRIQIQK